MLASEQTVQLSKSLIVETLVMRRELLSPSPRKTRNIFLYIAPLFTPLTEIHTSKEEILQKEMKGFAIFRFQYDSNIHFFDRKNVKVRRLVFHFRSIIILI